MDERGALIQSLRDELESLKRKVAELESMQSRSLKAHNAFGDEMARQLLRIFDQHIDNRDRIKNLEKTVFPNLPHALDEVDKIIGEPESGFSKLDRRDVPGFPVLPPLKKK